MTTIIQFALLGLGAGAAYAIAALGMVQIYQGSGILHLSHGAVAYAAAAIFVRTFGDRGWPLALAFAVAVGAAAAIGAVIQICVMYPLRSAPALVRMIATLGIFAILLQGVPLVFGTRVGDVAIRSFYPKGYLRLGKAELTLSYDRLIVAVVAVIVCLVLWTLRHKTKFGLSTTAVAESPVVAAALGVRPNRVATGNWVLGCALAGIAGVLLIPIIGVAAPMPFLFLVIPALAAAMIGRFEFFGLTLVGGLAIGIGQSILTRYQIAWFPPELASGWPQALPFGIIIVVLVVRGSPFPTRGEIVTRLPRLGRRTLSPLAALGLCAAATIGVMLTSDKTAGAISASAGLAVVGLSLVVLTGLAGQTSLAQMTIAGVGALVAARFSHDLNWPFPLVVALGVIGGTVVGVIFAGPAMRTRGPTLAIATIGIGIAIQSVVLNNGWFTVNGFVGTPVDAPSIGPLDIDGFQHPQRYAAFALVALIVTCYTVANFRAGRTGRRLIAMRCSERAASATGISLPATKLVAFTVSACLASLGGVILAFRGNTVSYEQFDLLQSLNLVIFTLIGGIGYVLGPVIGGVMAPNGLLSSLLDNISTVQRWLVIASGFTLVLTLIMNAHGIAAANDIKRGKERRRNRPIRTTPQRPSPEPKSLLISGLTVQYGSVTAVHDLTLEVHPGEIVGLIGPNGAGKTSALDAISGFTPAKTGHVTLGDDPLDDLPPHRRAASGMSRSFQTVETFDDMTVAENLAVASCPIGWTDWARDPFQFRAVELPEDVHAEAKALGLDLDAMPDELSQGQRRTLGVLRALAADPTILLLDEPAAGLDAAETERLGRMLRNVTTTRSIGILLVEHDMSLVGAICDRVVAMDFGQTIVSAPTAQALTDPTVRSAYLGELDELVPQHEDLLS